MAGYYPVGSNVPMYELDSTSTAIHQQQSPHLMPAELYANESMPLASANQVAASNAAPTSYEPLRNEAHTEREQPGHSSNRHEYSRTRRNGCCGVWCWVIFGAIIVIGVVIALVVTKPWAHHGASGPVEPPVNSTLSLNSTMPLNTSTASNSTLSTLSTVPASSTTSTISIMSTSSTVSTLSTVSKVSTSGTPHLVVLTSTAWVTSTKALGTTVHVTLPKPSSTL